MEVTESLREQERASESQREPDRASGSQSGSPREPKRARESQRKLSKIVKIRARAEKNG